MNKKELEKFKIEIMEKAIAYAFTVDEEVYKVLTQSEGGKSK